MRIGKTIKIGILIIILVSVLLFFYKRYINANKFEYAGTIEATKVDVSSQLTSIIKSISVQEGDRVNELENVIELTCESVQLAEKLAQINYERNDKLLQSGTVSQDTFDQVKNQKQVADLHLDWCQIQSPLSGTVLTRYHEPGELAMPGTKILTIANIKNVYAYIYVPEPDITALKIGQKLKAKVSELNHKEFIGTIIKINSEAEFTPKNVQTRHERERLIYGVKVSFAGANKNEILKPGMTIYIASLNPAKTNEH